ncbi:SDR family oxidoreductase [Haloechinothrix sp. LS1_15]|uniref:SDR family oxidoreductase n=1 Tax=Haloechinothrix sp. LS1_15 TaxID=2652248 RepID=UPI0029486692|nr:SDR family oxidoreductase [Haloechinothrix sp. LS1_15]MDV6011893.1 SDR family oxidoreductase [Haloechinothrix sp. LS1_15]
MSVAGMGVLVTGGGSGIGLGVARRLVGEGAHVTVCGRTETTLSAAAGELAEIATAGGTATYAVADVADEDAVAAAVTRAAEHAGGRLDGVVTCAGGSGWVGPITQLPLEEWHNAVATNLTGTMLALKHAGALMARAGGGSFVGISSIASSNTHRWFGPYGVTKAGVDHLCQLAADELGPSNVRVNCIRPGLIRTAMVEAITGSDNPVRDDYESCIPLPRIGEVDDVAELARFLIGPESSWVTGQVINVDGGHSLRRGPDLSPWLEPAYGADGLRGIVD